jgi:uncharacterized RDD family membrane protein YckC
LTGLLAPATIVAGGYMDLRDDQNPYAPPAATTEEQPFAGASDDEMQVAADRWTRWLARFIDGLLSLVLILPVMGYLLATDKLTSRDLQGNSLIGLYFWIPSLPLTIYQWYLTATTGQSLGKKWLKIRIIKTDGSPVNFVSGVILREWITAAIGLIPCVGPLVNLVGILMIFGQNQRCLHDHIAGTKVIAVLPSV